MLTQAEFCLCVGISRTSLWRYCKSPRSCSGFRSKPDVKKPLVADGWRNEAMKLCEKHVTYGYRRIQILLRKAGYEVGFHRVREWMRESGLAQTRSDTGRKAGGSHGSQSSLANRRNEDIYQAGWMGLADIDTRCL